MNNRMRTAAVIGRLFGRRVWTPAALPGLIAAPMFHLMQAAGCLWQDNAKTIPAGVGEPVYRTRCTFTGKEFAAASNAGRVILSDEGSGRRAGVRVIPTTRPITGVSPGGSSPAGCWPTPTGGAPNGMRGPRSGSSCDWRHPVRFT